MQMQRAEWLLGKREGIPADLETLRIRWIAAGLIIINRESTNILQTVYATKDAFVRLRKTEKWLKGTEGIEIVSF